MKLFKGLSKRIIEAEKNIRLLNDKVWVLENPAKFKRDDNVKVEVDMGIIVYSYTGTIIGVYEEINGHRRYYVLPEEKDRILRIENERSINPIS